MTAAPTITTRMNGARRQDEHDRRPDAGGAGVDLQVLATEAERVVHDDGRDQRRRDQAEASLEHRRQRSIADDDRARAP